MLWPISTVSLSLNSGRMYGLHQPGSERSTDLMSAPSHSTSWWSTIFTPSASLCCIQDRLQWHWSLLWPRNSWTVFSFDPWRWDLISSREVRPLCLKSKVSRFLKTRIPPKRVKFKWFKLVQFIWLTRMNILKRRVVWDVDVVGECQVWQSIVFNCSKWGAARNLMIRSQL